MNIYQILKNIVNEFSKTRFWFDGETEYNGFNIKVITSYGQENGFYFWKGDLRKNPYYLSIDKLGEIKIYNFNDMDFYKIISETINSFEELCAYLNAIEILI